MIASAWQHTSRRENAAESASWCAEAEAGLDGAGDEA
jgi:hypothetical protein